MVTVSRMPRGKSEFLVFLMILSRQIGAPELYYFQGAAKVQ
jgi:hypothetical protein